MFPPLCSQNSCSPGIYHSNYTLPACPSSPEVLIPTEEGPYFPDLCLVVTLVRKLVFASERNQIQTKLKLVKQADRGEKGNV